MSAVRFLAVWAALLAGVADSAADTGRSEARRLVSDAERAIVDGETAEARLLLVRAIEADPDYLAAYDVAIPLWLEAGELAELTRYLELATTRQRNYAFAWYTLGYAYRIRGRADLSIVAYETYLQLRPSDPDPRFGLALALIAEGEKGRAETELQRYLTLERRPERAKYIERARQLITSLGGTVPEVHERTIRSELERARELIAAHRYASAIAVLADLGPDRDIERAAAWVLRGRAHLGVGRTEIALAAGFVALALDGLRSEALALLADAFDRQGQGAVASYLRSLFPVEPADL